MKTEKENKLDCSKEFSRGFLWGSISIILFGIGFVTLLNLFKSWTGN